MKKNKNYTKTPQPYKKKNRKVLKKLAQYY